MRNASGMARLARAHALFNIGGGLWPLLSMRTFEAVSGPKADRWLVRTVAGLMVANGVAQWRAGTSDEALAGARRIGLGTAGTLAAVDLVYAPPGRISRVYLVDAVLEGAWVLAWLRSYRR
jgi:hypothetical protein